jgi:hypothetical protein
VLVAFPMKRRFINDEQQPFPEGRACGVVLDTLYTGAARSGMFKAKMLAAVAASLAGFISFISGESYMKLIQMKWHGAQVGVAPAARVGRVVLQPRGEGNSRLPRLAGVELRQMGVSPALDLAMFGAGGLMGIRPATSMMVGMLLNFLVIVPWMISPARSPSRSIADGSGLRAGHILNNWALWWGISIMVTASHGLALCEARRSSSRRSGRLLRRAKTTGDDPVSHIELPLWISWSGIPVVGAVGVWMAHDWFGVSWVFGATAIPLIIDAHAHRRQQHGADGHHPHRARSPKIPQFLFGALDPKHPPTNLMTGVMCVEVASNASNLLMDIKPGYMLGGKPRQQAIGHIIGIFSGRARVHAAVLPALPDRLQPRAGRGRPQHVQNVMAPDEEGSSGSRRRSSGRACRTSSPRSSAARPRRRCSRRRS